MKSKILQKLGAAALLPGSRVGQNTQQALKQMKKIFLPIAMNRAGMNGSYFLKTSLSIIGLCLGSLSSIAQNYNVTTSPQCNNTAGGTETILFTGVTPTAVGNGTLTAYFKGDLDLTTEFLEFFGETASAAPLGVSISTAQCDATYDSVVITIPMTDINAWAADGTISFLADASSSVSSTCTSPGTAFCVYMKLDYPRASGLNDIGIASVDSPRIFCAGPQDIWVTAQNFGINQVDTFTINWTWNGTPQPSLNLYQLLDTAQGLNPTNLQVMLGSKTITDADTLVVWTSNPENGADTSNTNDTITRVIVPGLMGTQTINSAVTTGGTNYQTFTDFAYAVNNYGICGPVVVNVATGSGPYNEQITILQVPGISSTNTITINGNGTTITANSTDAGNRATIRLNGADHVHVNNLNITSSSTGTSQYGFGVQLLADADSNSFTNCYILVDSTTASTNYTPVVISGDVSSATTAGSNCDGNIFTGCYISGGYYSTVLYGNAAAPLVSGNTFTNNTLRNFYNYGFYIYGSDGTVMEGNDISRPNRTNSTTFAGVIFSGLNRNALFSKNRIHNAFDMMQTSTSAAYPIYSSSSDATLGNENEISNNLIYDINNAGIIYGIYNTGSNYYKYYHNTISLDNTTATTASTTRGIYQTTAATALEFKNNIISVTRGGSGAKYGIFMNTATTTWTASNNNYFVTGAGTNNIGSSGGNDYNTIAGWLGAVANDVNSISVQPLFTSPATGDYTPGNTALDNMGTPVGILSDLNNGPRSGTTPDIGAYEFTPPQCSGTPAVASATVNGTTSAAICSGSNILLDLQGYSIGGGITYQWESSPVGQNMWTPISGATNPTSVVIATTALDYRAVTTCNGNPTPSNTVTTSINPFYACYCSPNTGVILHSGTTNNYITNVNITNTPLNYSTSAIGPGAYTFVDPSIATNTATLFIGSSYTLNITNANTTYEVEGWIDWDQSGTFDANEFLGISTGTLNPTATITPPVGAQLGMTGMRLRSSTTSNFGASGACSDISAGRETEDYVITIAPTPTCVAPTALNATGITTNDITINWTGSVSMPVMGYDYYYSTTNVAPTASTPPSGSVVQGSINATITGLPPGTPHYFWVRSNCGGNDYSIWAGPLQASTLIVNDEASGAIPLTVNPDYNCGTVATGTTIGATQSADAAPSCNPTGINDDVWYSFVATATEHRVTLYGLNAIMSAALYEGPIGTLTQVSGSCAATTAVLTAANLYASGLTIGNTYYIRAYTNVATTTTTSNFTICVGTLNATPPANDDCVNSIDISNQQVFNGSQASATQSIASCNAVANANDVWYHFTTGASGGSVTVNVISTYADMVIETLTGTCGGTMTGLIATASTTASGSCLDGPAIGTEFGTYTVAPFTTYYVRVYGFTNPINNDQGTFTIQVTGTPLAVKLSDITAVNVGNRNRVDWTTAAEASGDAFEVQRSIDGRNYSTLATINAKGTASTYSYWDVAPVTGKNYYRLYMKDATGNSSYSKVVTAVVAGEGGFALTAQPNPVTSKLTVVTYGTQGKNPTISVLDVTGKVISSVDVNSTATELNMDKLAAGIYLIRYTDNSRTETIRVHKQ